MIILEPNGNLFVANQSEKCNDNPNMNYVNKIRERLHERGTLQRDQACSCPRETRLSASRGSD